MKFNILLLAMFVPGCCGLRLAETLTPEWRQNGKHPEKVILGTHHKTGTALASLVGKCIQEHAGINVTVLDHIGQEQHVQSADNEPIIHFLRDPESWGISWYQYSKTKSEDWFTRPGSMAQGHGQDELIQKYISSMGYNITIDDKESRQDFLKRVPEDLGLAVAYSELMSEMPDIMEFTTQCRSDPMCKEVCLESFGESRASYDAAWEGIFSFMNTDWPNNKELQNCVKSKYIGDTRSDHATSGMTSEEQHQKYVSIIRQFDRESGGGRLSQASKDVNCSGVATMFAKRQALLPYE